MNKKILIGSIIAVVILVLVSSSSAVDVNYDNNEIEPVDTTIEIISFISGFGYEYEYEGDIIFLRNVSLFDSERGFTIRAFTINPLRLFHKEEANVIHANRFIGLILDVAPGIIMASGIALGNIEWS